VGGRKMCGVLVERASGPAGAALLIGIGVNVNHSEASFPEELRSQATSIAIELGRTVSRADLLAAVVSSLEGVRKQAIRKGSGSLMSALERRLDLIGNLVRIEQEHGRPIEGVAQGVDGDGGLVIRQSGGSQIKVFAGSLIELRNGR